VGVKPKGSNQETPDREEGCAYTIPLAVGVGDVTYLPPR